METSRVVRLLSAVVVLLVLLVAGLGAGLFVTVKAANEADARRHAALSQVMETSSAARQALAHFEEERAQNSGDPGGPLGRLDRQIKLMSIMVEQQMVLISEMAGMHEAAAKAMGGSSARAEARSQPRKR
jgi:uncharacterized protein HemX